MGMVVGVWRSRLHSETFWILSAVPSTWSTLQALCVSLSLNVWGRLEWTFWIQAITKGMLSCKKCRSAWWVWLRGVSRGGDTMEEERVTIYMSSLPIHLYSFGWFMYCFHFIVCSLRKPFYSLLSNFPWLHACYKVFSWNVIAGQDGLELTSLHLELFPWLQAVPVQAELLWHRELHGRGGGTRRIFWLLLSGSCSTHQFLGETSSLM